MPFKTEKKYSKWHLAWQKKSDFLQFNCKQGWSWAWLSTAISLICWQLLKPSSHTCTAKTLLQFLYCNLSLIMKCHLVFRCISWGQQGIMQHIKTDILMLEITRLFRAFFEKDSKDFPLGVKLLNIYTFLKTQLWPGYIDSFLRNSLIMSSSLHNWYQVRTYWI